MTFNKAKAAQDQKYVLFLRNFKVNIELNQILNLKLQIKQILVII